MRKIEQWIAYHIVSEPGDGTRYDYYIASDGPDSAVFMPCKNSFRYPQRLNYWDIKDIEDGDILALAEAENCNPWTLRECINCFVEMRGR